MQAAESRKLWTTRRSVHCASTRRQTTAACATSTRERFMIHSQASTTCRPVIKIPRVDNSSPRTRSSWATQGSKFSPTGRAVGIDDAAGFVVGGFVGTAVYAGQSALTRQPITLGGLGGSFLSGGI